MAQIYIWRLGAQGGRGRRSLGKLLQEDDRDRDGRTDRGKGRGEESKVVEVHGMKTSEEVTGLRLYSQYELSITAFNSKGEGPHSEPHHFSTPEGGEFR